MKGNNFRLLYFRYKESSYYSLLVVVGIILVCALLVVAIIIPQLQSWFPIREEITATQARIKVLDDNITFMNSIDRSALASQFTVATDALPVEKDFGSVLNAISDASVKSNISLEDFTFQVGKVGSAAATPQDIGVTENGLPVIEIKLSIMGSIDNTQLFLQQVREKLPLSQVKEIDQNDQQATISLQYFQKPLPALTLHDDEPIMPVSDDKKKLIEKISAWEISPTPGPTTSSSSASLSVPLFPQ